MDKKIKIIIADDHMVFSEGIAALIDGGQLKVVAICKNGREVLDTLKNQHADLLITDINMPILDGISLTKKVKKLYPKLKVIMLSMYEEKHIVNKAIRNGADGYMSKNLGKKEILLAINKCIKGEQYVSKRINKISQTNIKINDNMIQKLALTHREKEILQQIVTEKSNSEIALSLDISKRTVETHKKNLMLKLGVNSTVGLTKFAIKNNLIVK